MSIFAKNITYYTRLNGRVVRHEWSPSGQLLEAEYTHPNAWNVVGDLRDFKISRFIHHRGGDTQGKYAAGEKAELERKAEADAKALLERF